MDVQEMEGVTFDLDGEDVPFEELVEAYKAAYKDGGDVTGEGAREKAREAQKKRSKKYGIAVLEDVGSITKPSQWADLSDAEFADPVNYRFPIHDVAHARNAAARFAQETITYKGRSVVEERIDEAKKKFKIGEYREGKAVEIEKKAEQVRSAWREQFAKPSVPGGETPWYRVRVFEDPDLAVVELPEGLYAYPFTEGEDGIEFGDPYEIEFVIQPKERKAIELDQRVKQVRDAWREQYTKPKMPGEEPRWWDIRVFTDPDVAVVELPDGLFAYPFSEDDDGITFDDPYAVEMVIKRKDEKAWRMGEWANQREETMIAFGGEIKALGGGCLGGYLVRFGSEDEKDLTGEWFTEKTYFGPRDGDGADTMIHHGIPMPADTNDPVVKAQLTQLAQRFLAPLKVKKDAIGLWAETVCKLADEYERMVYGMAELGKLKWSSGSTRRQIRVEPTGEITRWYITEGSLTPIPAEFRGTQVMPLKSYLETLSTAAPETGGADAGASGLEAAMARARVELLLTELEEGG